MNSFTPDALTCAAPSGDKAIEAMRGLCPQCVTRLSTPCVTRGRKFAVIPTLITSTSCYVQAQKNRYQFGTYLLRSSEEK